jgi:uncharacterized membrane protein
MEELFLQIASTAALLTEGAAVVIVMVGVVEAFAKLVGVALRPASSHGVRKEVWRRFGTWLLLGLEFALAADIVRSVISPTWEDIGRLGAIAVIRTFLNYFLEHDLENAARSEAA